MKKWNIFFIIVIVFTGLNLYAANGDLFVNGRIGVGTSSPYERFHLSGNALISGDIFFYQNWGGQRGSIHYGPFGKIGQTYNFTPGYSYPGLWIEGSHNEQSAGIFLNGDTMVLWSPGNTDILRVYDEDFMPSGQPLFVIDRFGNIGILHAPKANRIPLLLCS